VRALTLIALSDQASSGERALVRSQAAGIPEVVDSIERGLGFVMRETPMLAGPLQAHLEEVKAATEEFVIDIEARFIGEDPITAGRWLPEFWIRADRTMEAVDRLAGLANTQLNARLVDRIARLNRTRGGSLAAVFLIIALTTALLVWLARAITRPVTQLAESAARLSVGDLSVQVPVTSGDEIGRLTATFNQTVQNYNVAVRRFPTNLIAGMLGFPPRPFFTAQPGAEKPPPVQFNFGSPAPAPAATP